ncbi:DUF4167 domain-containing protein [Marinicauda salina]|uniref:DUF4167 domain-containing protein n=1 Tax=Marinicauda salina TaxID=2135793 RepID=A0A2U2BS04_9PROT|nr:DUF4167 domain-containing protein [Marinicauda salina]PWE16793.1 DUF4167 domain-containing protein [Marinicauda salina]
MKRQRGRGRKSGNQGNRSFESNGPDVKVRGNASHIHDKYLQLARDAMSSGDRVMAENYYQHAEHYLRVMQANQPKRDENSAEDGADQRGGQQKQQGQQDQPNGGGRDDRGRGRGDGKAEAAQSGDGKADGRSRRGGRSKRANGGEGGDPLQVVTPEGSDDEDGEGQSAGAESEKPKRRARKPRTDAAAEEALKKASGSDDDKDSGDKDTAAA